MGQKVNDTAAKAPSQWEKRQTKISGTQRLMWNVMSQGTNMTSWVEAVPQKGGGPLQRGLQKRVVVQQ